MESILQRRLRVGVIPAGSTDAVACSTTGTRDPATASLWIALGARLPIDVAEVDDPRGGTAAVSGTVGSGSGKRHVVSFLGYGYYGDIIRTSDSMRFLGPARYDVMGALAFFLGRTYAARVSFLPPVENPDADLEACRQDFDAPLCAAGDDLNHQAAEAMAEAVANRVTGRQRRLSLGQKLGRALKQLDANRPEGESPATSQASSQAPSLLASPVGAPTQWGAAASDASPAAAAAAAAASKGMNGSGGRARGRPSSSSGASRRLSLDSPAGGGQDAPKSDDEQRNGAARPGQRPANAPGSPTNADERRQQGGPRWMTIEGEFKVVGCAVLSCRCDQAPDGLAKYAQICDGNMQLFLVRNCSRWQFLRHLAALAFGGNAFDFDFVELYKVSGVHVEPLHGADAARVAGKDMAHRSSWNVDGEVGHGTLLASAKRGLVDVFARGPELA